MDFHFGAEGTTDLRRASFDGAAISNATLFSLDLRDASFHAAELDGVDLQHSDLRRARFDDAVIEGRTTFDETCLSKASFVRTSFNVFIPIGERQRAETTFIGAKGKDVDFSDAVNLSSVRLDAGVTDVRFEGANERPRRTRTTGRFAAGPGIVPCK